MSEPDEAPEPDPTERLSWGEADEVTITPPPEPPDETQPDPDLA